MSVDPSKTEYTLSSLTSDTLYTVRMMAYTDEGGRSGPDFTFTTQKFGKEELEKINRSRNWCFNSIAGLNFWSDRRGRWFYKKKKKKAFQLFIILTKCKKLSNIQAQKDIWLFYYLNSVTITLGCVFCMFSEFFLCGKHAGLRCASCALLRVQWMAHFVWVIRIFSMSLCPYPYWTAPILVLKTASRIFILIWM